MTSHISHAIIMRTREFGETDLLVTFFTPDRGQQKGIAKGARKSRKRFVNCLDICSLVNLEYGKGARGDLCFLSSGKLLDAFPGLRRDFSTLTKASYMIELTEILFPLGVIEERIFEFLRDSLNALADGRNRDSVHILFEARAMALGGYGIELEKCGICGRTYRGDGMAVFRREAGGIACLKCHQPSRLSPLLRPEGVKALKDMQEGALPPLEDREMDEDVLLEIRSLQKLHREYHLGLRPKTASYLE